MQKHLYNNQMLNFKSIFFTIYMRSAFTVRQNETKCNVPGELPMACMPADGTMLPVLLALELLGIC